MPRGAVWIDPSERTISGSKNEFHVHVKYSTIKARIAGRAGRNRILDNVAHGPAPSIDAASMTERGTARNVARIQKDPKATPKAVSERMRPTYELRRS